MRALWCPGITKPTSRRRFPHTLTSSSTSRDNPFENITDSDVEDAVDDLNIVDASDDENDIDIEI